LDFLISAKKTSKLAKKVIKTNRKHLKDLKMKKVAAAKINFFI